MVVFTCSYCGESLKKNKVEKHYTFAACKRNSPALTCVDCLKDFLGNDYVAHISCVTEQERYSAKGFVSKPPSEKGKRKQEMWVKSINEVLNNRMNIDPNTRKVLQKIAEDFNVPQKKPKFMNYCHSKFKAWCRHIHFERAWEVLENVQKKLKTDSKEESNKDDVNLDDRKRKRVDSSNNSPNDESFNSPSELKTENGDFSTSKLQKKHKKNKRNEGQPEVDAAVNENADETKKLKKSKKKNLKANGNHSVEDIEMNSIENNKEALKDNQNHENDYIFNNELNGNTQETKLSKKEKKQKRKQEKYKKQLMEINEAVSEKASEVIEDDIPKENGKIKKKKKDLPVTGSCGETETLNGESGNIKKKKKHKEPLPEIEVEEHDGSAEVEITKRNKFNWEEIIIQVLESKGELPLKRLEKKVVSEYVNTCATVKSVEEALAKFHKKVMKIPRVKVRKEVAKLVP